jgi:Glycosyl hydrolase family 30 beta sandwich domain
MMTKIIISIFLMVQSIAYAWTPMEGKSNVSIVLNPGIKYQTMTGWEATAQAGQTDCPGFDQYKNTLYDQAVYDLGINRVRVELHNSATIPYNYVELDSTIEKIVLPLQERLNQTGEKLFVNINFVGFSSSGYTYKNNPAVYADLVLQTYQHLENNYGFTPDAWEVILEADNANWSPDQIGNAIALAASRLHANGYIPYFIAPSTTSMQNAVAYFDTIIQIPGVQPYLRELSYHRYTGASAASLRTTAMLEHIGSDYLELHQDLKIGGVSAWQQYTLAYCTQSQDGSAYYYIDETNPSNPSVILGERTKYLRQYFKYIRRGAVRIEASSDIDQFDPLAFINKDGTYVVVVKASQGGSISIDGLPAGQYSIYYTTADQYDVWLDDISVLEGQSLDTSIPSPGVITIFRSGASGPYRLYLPVIF